MTANEPPPGAPPQSMVPMLTMPVPQQVSWQSARDGTTGILSAHVLVASPLTTTLLVLDKDSALRLAAGLNEIFDGIEVAHAMPRLGIVPPNGRGAG